MTIMDSSNSNFTYSKSVFDVLQKDTTLNQLDILLEQQKQLREQLLLEKNGLESKSRKEVKKVAAGFLDNLQEFVDRFNDIQNNLKRESKGKIPQKLENPEIYIHLEKLSILEKSSDYINVFQYIRSSSERIDQCLHSGKTLESLDYFARLQLIQDFYLCNTQCLNLLAYCRNTVSYWETELTKIITKKFEDSQEEMGWPLRIVQSNPTGQQKEKFNVCITSILRLCSLIPNVNKQKDLKKPILLVDFMEPIFPIVIMMKPLRKRFRFNFFGTNVTSRESKPEWYFSQVKNWVRDLVPFLKEYIEPISISVMDISSVIEFVRALSELVVIKADIHLMSCLDNNDNLTFARILEESITYEREVGQVLIDVVTTSKSFLPPLVSTLFSQTHILKQWLVIEKAACQEKLDEIFSSSSAWDRAVVPGPPEIVYLFLALMRFITDRFSHLQQPGQRLQFLQMLIDMVDDFRYRCLQIWKSRNETVEDFSSTILFDYVMADALWHIQVTLEQWEDLPLFESMSFFLERINEMEEQETRLLGSAVTFNSKKEITDNFVEYDGKRQALIGTPNKGLFSDVQNLYECLGDEIMSTWSNCVMQDVGESILSLYVTLKWHNIPDQEIENMEIEVSPELLMAIRKLCSVCKTIESALVPQLSEKWLKRLAVSIDDLLIEKLITTTKFSKGAIQQLKLDFRRGLFPIFMEYKIDTALFFPGVTSAIKVWEMLLGDAMLIFDELTSTGMSHVNKEELLAEMDITVKPSEVLRLLKTRADIIC